MSISSEELGNRFDVGSDWQEVGSPVPAALGDARLQLHWAAQVVGAVGHTFGTPEPDDSHTAPTWVAGSDMMVGQPVGHDLSLQSALAPSRMALRVLSAADGTALDEFLLSGTTLDQAYAWMAQALESHSGGEIAGQLTRRDYDMPDHPVGRGADFHDDDRRAMAEVARWFANASRVLGLVVRARREAQPLRLWPHHFDIGTLIPLLGPVGEEPSVGLGMSPGDQTYPEPYWYVTAWPTPQNPTLPPLAGKGSWHTEGWIGAVLLGTDIVLAGRSPAQASLVGEFLESAIPAAITLLS